MNAIRSVVIFGKASSARFGCSTAGSAPAVELLWNSRALISVPLSSYMPVDLRISFGCAAYTIQILAIRSLFGLKTFIDLELQSQWTDNASCIFRVSTPCLRDCVGSCHPYHWRSLPAASLAHSLPLLAALDCRVPWELCCLATCHIAAGVS